MVITQKVKWILIFKKKSQGQKVNFNFQIYFIFVISPFLYIYIFENHELKKKYLNFLFLMTKQKETLLKTHYSIPKFLFFVTKTKQKKSNYKFELFSKKFYEKNIEYYFKQYLKKKKKMNSGLQCLFLIPLVKCWNQFVELCQRKWS